MFDSNNKPKANPAILKGNGTANSYIEVHKEFDTSTDGQDYQKINNNNWFFTITNKTLNIGNFDGSVQNSFPFSGTIFN